MAFAPDKIRNVAVVGHRGTGKTSLTEALLFQAGEITPLGSVADGTTVSDHDDDERRRGLSISASLIHAEWNGRMPSWKSGSHIYPIDGSAHDVGARAGGIGQVHRHRRHAPARRRRHRGPDVVERDVQLARLLHEPDRDRRARRRRSVTTAGVCWPAARASASSSSARRSSTKAALIPV